MGAMATRQEQEIVSSTQAPLRLGMTALVIGNICLAFGPWFVRMADSGPVSAAFWRIALAAPCLFIIARAVRDPVPAMPRRLVGLFVIAGVLFAADLAAWHLGILQTKLANANLFGNSTSFLLPLYAFIVARQ